MKKIGAGTLTITCKKSLYYAVRHKQNEDGSYVFTTKGYIEYINYTDKKGNKFVEYYNYGKKTLKLNEEDIISVEFI